MTAMVERIYGAKVRVLEWKEDYFSGNKVSESEAVFILRAYTGTGGVEEVTEFPVKDVHVFRFNLHHLLSPHSLQSFFDCPILSTPVFLEDGNARALSDTIFTYLACNYQFTSKLNSFLLRKSKIVVIVVDVFLERFVDNTIIEEGFYLELPRNDDYLDILSTLRSYLHIEPTPTHEPADVLKEIEGAVKVNRVIDGQRSPADKCRICLQGFLMGTDVATTPCSHVFHSNCIFEWLPQTNSCPVCESVCGTVIHI
ncbi:uncharacterized protein LOC132279765 [Cornus florida]|uniref:uncharacterized protein LOC132279765 n=1 Tax=Cornus florida TaxID=4283 RepID=UPI00289D5637|nr:uncharacterized protein LOC132279765 [Cornus florida]XP_059637788.1 uncharacterized protein LOC132279765 [Cornus florida]